MKHITFHMVCVCVLLRGWLNSQISLTIYVVMKLGIVGNIDVMIHCTCVSENLTHDRVPKMTQDIVFYNCSARVPDP